jgi:hypothetical protein
MLLQIAEVLGPILFWVGAYDRLYFLLAKPNKTATAIWVRLNA